MSKSEPDTCTFHATMLPVTVGVFAIGFLAGDAAGVMGTVRVSALAFLAVTLLAVAFRNAGRLTTAEDGPHGVRWRVSRSAASR